MRATPRARERDLLGGGRRVRDVGQVVDDLAVVAGDERVHVALALELHASAGGRAGRRRPASPARRRSAAARRATARNARASAIALPRVRPSARALDRHAQPHRPRVVAVRHPLLVGRIAKPCAPQSLPPRVLHDEAPLVVADQRERVAAVDLGAGPRSRGRSRCRRGALRSRCSSRRARRPST